jgi:hypothetical protein
MRYVTAKIGAIVIFVGCAVGAVILTAYRPFQGVLRISIGGFSIAISNPVALVGIPIGILAAVRSFRSTLKRFEAKEGEKSRANQDVGSGRN